MIYKHFLATRFNVRIGGWDTTKNGETLLDDIWMDNRFELFENYCFPSVINQFNQNFTWCIYFDLNTNEVYKQRIKKLTEPYPNIRIFFINSIGELKPHLIDFIKSGENNDCDYIITSRLDTDDLLHRDYIKVVQQLFKPKHNCIIDLRCGYQISIERGECQIRNYTNNFNPFISFIEKKECVETVFNQMHKEWLKAENVIVDSKNKLWIELVHTKNKINTVNCNLEYALKFNEKEFGLNGKFLIAKNISYYVFFLRIKTRNLFFFSKQKLKQTLRLAFPK